MEPEICVRVDLSLVKVNLPITWQAPQLIYFSALREEDRLLVRLYFDNPLE